MTDLRTAFVSHYDCSRHDTGWGHPDHQGRLPAVMRTIHADMLTLFDRMVEVEGRHAQTAALESFHDPTYVETVREWVRNADTAGGPIEVRPGLLASSASWDASIAAVGCVLEGVDVVLSGGARNAFCAVRPTARDAGVREPGRFGFFNQVAVVVDHLWRIDGLDRILVIEWGTPPANLGSIQAMSGKSVSVIRSLSTAEEPARTDEDIPRPIPRLEHALDGLGPDFVILSASFDGLPGDPLVPGELSPDEYYSRTTAVREFAESACSGRLVSVLEGGYSPALGATIVAHLRALAGLPPVGDA